MTKHRPVVGVAWDDVVRSTGGKGKAKYGPHPEINEPMSENMEMETVTGMGTELPRPKEHVRAFWQKMNRDIGASRGQTTPFIFVEYHMNGAVHGYPITEKELRAKGMET